MLVVHRIERPSTHRLVKADTGTIARRWQNQLGTRATGTVELTGSYDFSLSFAAASSVTPDADPPPDITAVQQQLGLRLEPSQTRIGIVVVDHVERALSTTAPRNCAPVGLLMAQRSDGVDARGFPCRQNACDGSDGQHQSRNGEECDRIQNSHAVEQAGACAREHGRAG